MRKYIGWQRWPNQLSENEGEKCVKLGCDNQVAAKYDHKPHKDMICNQWAYIIILLQWDVQQLDYVYHYNDKMVRNDLTM